MSKETVPLVLGNECTNDKRPPVFSGKCYTDQEPQCPRRQTPLVLGDVCTNDERPTISSVASVTQTESYNVP